MIKSVFKICHIYFFTTWEPFTIFSQRVETAIIKAIAVFVVFQPVSLWAYMQVKHTAN